MMFHRILNIMFTESEEPEEQAVRGVPLHWFREKKFLKSMILKRSANQK